MAVCHAEVLASACAAVFGQACNLSCDCTTFANQLIYESAPPHGQTQHPTTIQYISAVMQIVLCLHSDNVS